MARVLLALADGLTYREVAEHTDCSKSFKSKWKRRFLADRLAGVYVRNEGKESLTPRLGLLHPEHLHHLIAQVIDHLHRDPP